MRNAFGFGRPAGILVGLSAVLAFGIQSFAAKAQTAAAASDGDAPKMIVQTTTGASHAGRPYFIEFRARSAASYGHMYVLYGKVNSSDQIISSRIAGLHPAGDAADCVNCSVVNWTIGHLIPVPSETGASDGDLEEKYVTARFRVWLTQAEYKKIDAYIRKLQAENPMWNALWNNCVKFGRDVAEFMGLKVPFSFWLQPKEFIDTLREENGVSREQLPLKDAAVGGKDPSVNARPQRSQRPGAQSATESPSTAKTAYSRPKKQPVVNVPDRAEAMVSRSQPQP
jgi:hypothetical protein